MVMKENIITISSEIESEAYQALSKLRKYPQGSGFLAYLAGLLKKRDGHITLEEGYDTGAKMEDDTAKGGLIGSLFGILGGPPWRTDWRQHGSADWQW